MRREARVHLTTRRRTKLNEEVRIGAGHILPIPILLSRSPLNFLLGIRSLCLAYLGIWVHRTLLELLRTRFRSLVHLALHVKIAEIPSRAGGMIHRREVGKESMLKYCVM